MKLYLKIVWRRVAWVLTLSCNEIRFYLLVIRYTVFPCVILKIDQSRHKVTEDLTEKTKMSFLLLSFVFTIILSYKIRDKTILHVDSHLLKELVQLCPIEVKDIKVQRCMIFHNSLFTCFNKCMMNFAGGTGDGKDNPKQVKTDKVLPAYCNPPNPCPIGYTCK